MAKIRKPRGTGLRLVHLPPEFKGSRVPPAQVIALTTFELLSLSYSMDLPFLISPQQWLALFTGYNSLQWCQCTTLSQH